MSFDSLFIIAFRDAPRTESRISCEIVCARRTRATSSSDSGSSARLEAYDKTNKSYFVFLSLCEWNIQFRSIECECNIEFRIRSIRLFSVCARLQCWVGRMRFVRKFLFETKIKSDFFFFSFSLVLLQIERIE